MNLLLLIGLPLFLLLSGYLLAVWLKETSAAERLAVAVLGGLALLLWNIAAVNFFRPLAGAWAWLCLWPVAVTLLWPAARTTAWRDVATVAGHRRGAVALALASGFLIFLLWPLLSRPELVYYDGTSNHDAFFWIVAAEHLMRHTYMELPPSVRVHPLMDAVPAIIGWQPAWGRMGGEGFLALLSSLSGSEPVRIYLAATAALFVPWIAAVFLTVRTFLSNRLGSVGTFALVALQPVFVFFHGNANLPNLLGALCAGGVVAAVERALRGGPGRGAWLALLAFSLHGLLCSYPEMLPFVALPAGLLWLRAWFSDTLANVWRPAAATAGAVIVGLALNPTSSARAWYGFVTSFETARANLSWANLFDRITPLQYVPALATLSVGATKILGVLVGAVLTILLLAALALTLRRARDRFGAWFILSGAGALLAYTIITGFNYGWQKTVQFGGPLWAAFFPVAILDTLAAAAPTSTRRRRIVRSTLLAILALFGYATFYNCVIEHQWSQRKMITEDWFRLRGYAHQHLAGSPLLIDGATFPMMFFHSMWATYFLPDSSLYFAARGYGNGGYLRDAVRNESRDPLPALSGVLVSRAWAESFDANSPRLFSGDTVALLARSNRLVKSTGLFPDDGPPEQAYTHVAIELLPHTASQLVFAIASRNRKADATTWEVRRETAGAPDYVQRLGGPPPWRLVVPLVADQVNRVSFIASPVPDLSYPPFAVREVRIENQAPERSAP
ncbi:hypothetical protein [Opitutus terrae]|uniref:Glycosyltransferase RgtA/B/C/D-like domain-containing protein n=1 Tax=Opitutus terrae (strain DSM 11246 / JCM 15787 / PB90-1) TaxID=452637 RepID=B1ZZU2_OPITP|nr:hypothetical protein [Opitutus terrae]ACB77278.1 hypothetical protein Oter_4004 [Opitutus terrae PB90-1]